MAGCIDVGGGKLCPAGGTSNPCDPFQLSKTADNCLYDSVVAESLNIGGAPLNFYKLLGVTARNNLQDDTGRGAAIGSRHIAGFPPSNAFGRDGSFRSAVRGVDVIADAFLGWDFGTFIAPSGFQRYVNVAAHADRTITAVTLSQSNCEEWTASRLRVERSADGVRWFGVAVIENVEPGLKTYVFADTVPSRFWRIRPLEFRGGQQDFWEVADLLFHESGVADINNIEDKVLFENRNKEYSLTPLMLKGTFAHQDAMLELMAHGMGLNQSLMIEVSFAQAVAVLGRPPVIGDIIEMPSEAMYDQNLNVAKKFVEVMDVAWSSTSYTPGWQPTLLRLKVDPAVASRETRQIFGGKYSSFDAATVFEQPALPGAVTQDYTSITETIRSEARTEMPKRGIDQSNTGQPTPAEQQAVAAKIGEENVAPFIKPQKGLYVEDALPPNGEPYTEGPELPSTAADGAYHRVTYSGAASDIPARLYRFSGVKGRWIYLETDKRAQHDPLSPMLLKR